MIRKFTPTDTESIISIWMKASELAHPFLSQSFVDQVAKDMQSAYIPSSKTWLFVEDQQIVGFISLLGNEIGGLYIIPDEQARGIGTQLVNFASLMYDVLEVKVFAKNFIGRSFYNKYGFKYISEYFHSESQEYVVKMRYGQ